MKRFNEYTEQINESLMLLLVYSAIVASMVQDAKQERLKYKIEQRRLEKELKDMEDREEDEKIQQKIEKERRRRELAQERHDRKEEKFKRMIAKFQMIQDKLADSRQKKLETQRFALAAHNMMNDEDTKEDRDLIEKHAKNKEKCTVDQIKKATEKANEISDEDADKYVEEHMPKKKEKDPEEDKPKKEKDTKSEPKEEEVVNPETGKKEKHKVYTGKRGGKYWLSSNNTKVYIKESEEQDSATRSKIINSRLAYLQWAIDNTKDKKKASGLKEIYNALYNITYDKDGNLRSLDSVIDYITKTMQDNNGKIPGLPSNDQIEEIDKKAGSLEDVHPDEYKDYVKKIEEEILKNSKTSKKDQADDVLDPEEVDSDKEARKKIAELTSVFGFTNIIGMEANKKPSAEDVKKKSEMEKDKKDNAMLQDTEDEENNIKKPEKSGEDSGEDSGEESDESDKLSDIEQDMLMYVVMMSEEYLDQYGKDEYDEADVDKWLDDQDLESELGIEDEDEKKGFRDAMKQEIKNELESDSDEGSDEEFGEEETNESLLEFSSNFIFELFGGKDAFKTAKKNAEMFNKYGEDAYKPELTVKEIKKAREKNASAVKFNKIANMLTGPIGAAIINKKQENMKRKMAGMKSMIENTKNPDEKEKLQKSYDLMMQTCVTKNGRFRARPKIGVLPEGERAEFKSKYEEIKHSKSLRQAGKNYLVKHEDFADQVIQDKASEKKEKKEIKKGHVEKSKMSDGSTLVARKSEVDGHMIYTREKGGKTIEYMDKEEYQKRLASKKESVEHHFGSFKAFLESRM